MHAQVVYLGGDHRKHQKGSEEVRLAHSKRYVTEQIPAVSNWGSMLLGSSGDRTEDAFVCLRYPEGQTHSGIYLPVCFLHWLKATPEERKFLALVSCPGTRCKRNVLRQLLTAGNPTMFLEMMCLGGKGRVLIISPIQGGNMIPDLMMKEGCWQRWYF